MGDAAPSGEPGRVVSSRLPADEDAPGAARDVIASVITELKGAADHRRDDVTLAASEMVSNAVVHGPSGELELRVLSSRELIRIEVSDRGLEPFDWPKDMTPIGHWGLKLVEEFSDRFAVERRPWTLVWCEFDLG